MPVISRIFIRLSLFYLFSGFTIGTLLLVNKAYPLFPKLWQWLPAHIEWLLIGWLVQLIMGVAYWMLPSYSSTPVRGSRVPVLTALILLNGGVLFLTYGMLTGNNFFFGAGRIAELGAIIAFAIHIWPRVKPFSDAKKTT